eukprot:5756309-Pyramimonas_sp.AAC.1
MLLSYIFTNSRNARYWDPHVTAGLEGFRHARAATLASALRLFCALGSCKLISRPRGGSPGWGW